MTIQTEHSRIVSVVLIAPQSSKGKIISQAGYNHRDYMSKVSNRDNPHDPYSLSVYRATVRHSPLTDSTQETDRMYSRTIRTHMVQNVRGHYQALEATDITSPSFTYEGYIAVRQPTGIEIIEGTKFFCSNLRGYFLNLELLR